MKKKNEVHKHNKANCTHSENPCQNRCRIWINNLEQIIPDPYQYKPRYGIFKITPIFVFFLPDKETKNKKIGKGIHHQANRSGLR